MNQLRSSSPSTCRSCCPSGPSAGSWSCSVRAETPDIRNEIIQIANIFRASIIDVSLKSLTLALIGDETKADAMQKLLEAFGILELVRTGMVALERGAYTIGDETKEQTEFNLGKNFL
ncbi:MAG: acetolactate synthase small subunit [Flavonifractor plautii]